MKYTMPKINFSIVRKAQDAYNLAADEYNRRRIKTKTSMIEAVFSAIAKFFATIASPSLSYNMAVKELSPRPSPLSSRYNEFMRALRTDLESAVGDEELTSESIHNHFNYSQFNREILDRMIASVGKEVNELYIARTTQEYDSIWFMDTFTDSSKVDRDKSSGEVDIDRGVYMLSRGEPLNAISEDNVLYIDSDVIHDKEKFPSSVPYYGKRVGVESGLTTTDEEDIRPYGESATVTQSKSSVAQQMDKFMEAVNTAKEQTSRSIQYDEVHACMIDDNPDTFWEVELCARMKDVSTGYNSGAPHFFLKSAGLDGNTWIDRIYFDSATPHRYSFKNGYMVYSDTPYEYDKFYSWNGDYEWKKMVLRATINITLKEPRVIDNVIIRRRLNNYSTVTGESHVIYVTDIKTAGIDGVFTGIPSFIESDVSELENEMSVISKNEPTSAVKSQNKSQVVQQMDKFMEAVKGQNAPVTSEASTKITTMGAVKSEAHSMSRSSSRFGKRDVWNFQPREVTAIKITLETDLPSQLRYSMKLFEAVRAQSAGGYEQAQYILVQHGMRTDDASMLAYITDSSFLELILDQKSAKAIKGGGADIPYFNMATARTYTLFDRSVSDVFRWAIAVSEIKSLVGTYADTGTMTSAMYESPEPIDKVILHANYDECGGSIQFYIEPEGGQPTRIMPWDAVDQKFDTGKNVPKVLYFNSNLTQQERARTTYGTPAYIDTDQPATRFRVMAVMSRGDINTTPYIMDYKVKVIPKLEEISSD